ncbi:hypothetical protein M959_15252, partial [Chaetura pelagica]
QGFGKNGPVYVKVPFSFLDLMAWKQAAGTYRENPERMGRVVDTIIRTQDTDWNDLQVILDNLLDETEKQMALRSAKGQAEATAMNGTVDGTLEQKFPSGDAQWDSNPVWVKTETIKKMWVSYGGRNAVLGAVNWSKLYEVRQDK